MRARIVGMRQQFSLVPRYPPEGQNYNQGYFIEKFFQSQNEEK
jgi:hypothetical protein